MTVTHGWSRIYKIEYQMNDLTWVTFPESYDEKSVKRVIKIYRRGKNRFDKKRYRVVDIQLGIVKKW